MFWETDGKGNTFHAQKRGAKREFHKIGPRQLKHLLNIHFDVVDERSNNEEVCIICPDPACGDKTGNRSFNLKTNLTHCWRCGAKDSLPRVATLFFRHFGVEVDATDLEIGTTVTSLLEQISQELDGKAEQKQKQVVELPEGFLECAEQPTSNYTRLIGKMAVRKKLDIESFMEARVGYTMSGPWEPFAIFPVYELGKLVYYQGRTYSESDEGGSTKKFPSKIDVPLGSSHWVYGFDDMFKPGVETIIIVESILNVLSLRKVLNRERLDHIVPIAVFKHAISAPQKAKIMASRAKEICIMYDGDAIKSAWAEAEKLSSSRLMTVARMPVGIDANDDAELALERFQSRSKFSPLAALMDSMVD